MRILADHCVYGETVRILREAGHEITPLKQLIPPSYDDPDVISLATSLDAILLSNDKDFADIIKYPPTNFVGVIVLRITPRNENLVHNTLSKTLQKKDRDSLRGSRRHSRKQSSLSSLG